MRDVVNEIGPAASPSVNGLFSVAHQKECPAAAKGFLCEDLNIFPLEKACILELVDKEMVIAFGKGIIYLRDKIFSVKDVLQETVQLFYWDDPSEVCDLTLEHLFKEKVYLQIREEFGDRQGLGIYTAQALKGFPDLFI